jgi:hypothetical protein
MDRRGSGPVWFVILVVVVFALYSVTVALSTADKCGNGGREWQLFPPEWKCLGVPGFG